MNLTILNTAAIMKNMSIGSIWSVMVMLFVWSTKSKYLGLRVGMVNIKMTF